MMEEIPKSDSPCCSNSGCGVALESEENSMDTFQYTTDKADSFVIDMDSFSSSSSSSTLNKDNNTTNANSRFTRSLSRKGSQRWGDRKMMNGNATTVHDKDVNVIPAICSPKATLAGSITLEKPAVMAVGSTDHSISPHVHHQIGITANSSTNENKGITRRNSFRRTSSSWTLDPKRVLLLFATL